MATDLDYWFNQRYDDASFIDTQMDKRPEDDGLEDPWDDQGDYNDEMYGGAPDECSIHWPVKTIAGECPECLHHAQTFVTVRGHGVMAGEEDYEIQGRVIGTVDSHLKNGSLILLRNEVHGPKDTGHSYLSLSSIDSITKM